MTDYEYDEYFETMKQSLETMNRLLDGFEPKTEKEVKTNETDN